MTEQRSSTVTKAGIWDTIHSERKALAVDLGGLGEEGWSTRSLCPDWTVRDVVAHLTATAKLSTARFFPRLMASGFSLHRMQGKDIAAERGASTQETLARFQAQLDSTGAPPGPTEAMLGEVIVHSEDIRRPLGIAHTYPPEALTAIADFYKGSNLILGGKRRISGLTLQATDTDWAHGRGPTVSGPMLSLVMAITGRQAALDDLSGEGVAALRARP
jgi:uncharacterized protein (TIGR03083 family)